MLNKNRKRKRAVFLDRDGTILKEVEYLSDPDLIEILPDVEEAILRLNELGLLKIVVTNQSVVGRGIITLDRLQEIHSKLRELLRSKGIELDAIYFCPHKPEDNCDCRKPSHKMLLQAAKEHNIDLTKSFVIGDRLMDVLMGKSVEAKTVVIPSKWTSLDGDYKKFGADIVCNNLLEAALWIEKISEE